MKIKTIDINAKEWFDKVNGNSYFSAEVIINYGMKGEKTISMPFQYGYGDHYRSMAFLELQKEGYIKNVCERASDWKYYKEKGIIVRYNKQENCLKRELKQY